MRARERGFTLLELLLVVGILGAFLAAAFGTLVEAKRANDLCEDYSLELMGMRRAMASLEADLRESVSVETGKFGDLRLATPRGPVEYAVRDWALRRTAGGAESVLARGILDVSVTPEGGIHRVTVRLARPRRVGKRRPELTALVAPRAGEGAR